MAGAARPVRQLPGSDAADPVKILRIVLPRVIGYKAHPVLLGEWIYVDIDARVR